MLLWECNGAYDKLAFARLMEVFDKAGNPVGYLLTWGYEDGRQFTDYHADEGKAMESGHDWVLGCDYMELPDAIKEMYPDAESYIHGGN